MSWLYLRRNAVEDITPLIDNGGLDTSDVINMTNNYLDLTEGSENMDSINILIDRGINVEYEPQREN